MGNIDCVVFPGRFFLLECEVMDMDTSGLRQVFFSGDVIEDAVMWFAVIAFLYILIDGAFF